MNSKRKNLFRQGLTLLIPGRGVALFNAPSQSPAGGASKGVTHPGGPSGESALMETRTVRFLLLACKAVSDAEPERSSDLGPVDSCRRSGGREYTCVRILVVDKVIRGSKHL